MTIFQDAPDQNASGTARAEDLVGEGKKFKTVDDLAKGKLEADTFIEKLQREQKELREELDKRLTVEAALRHAQEAGIRVDPPQPKANDPPPARQAENEPDIDSRITKALEARDRNKATQDNLQTATAKLVEVYGTPEKAAEIVKARAEELGMTRQQLGDMASSNPKAFYRLVGLDAKPAEAPKASSWSNPKNPAAMAAVAGASVVKAGTYKHYEEIRRSDPAAYFSPRVQLQMDKDAREKGDSFYS